MNHETFKTKREEAVQYAKGVLAAEGLVWTDQLTTLAQRYTDGDISHELFMSQLVEIIRQTTEQQKQA